MHPTRSLLALALATLPAFAGAQELPDPRQLIDRYLEAIGGAEALRGNMDASAKVSMVIAENGMRGDMQIHVRGDDLATSMTFNGMEIRTGLLDGLGWAIDPMNGPRLLEGAELEDMRRNVDPDVATFSDRAIASLETVALADSEGRPCHRVEIEWKSGINTAACFGVDDGLMLYTESISVSPMGEVRQVVHMHDYKPLGKVLGPSRMRGSLMGMTQVMTIEDYRLGSPPDEVFALPPAILALREAQPAGQSAE